MVKSRLENLKIEYEKMEWRSMDELRRICVNMQESVNSTETLQWNINLLQGKQPPKPVKPVRDVSAEAEVGDSKEIEGSNVEEVTLNEVIETGGGDDDANEAIEYEEVNEDDGMDGFVVGDDEVGEEIQDGETTLGDIVIKEDDSDTESTVMAPNSPVKVRSKRRIIGSEQTDNDVEANDERDARESECQTYEARCVRPVVVTRSAARDP